MRLQSMLVVVFRAGARLPAQAGTVRTGWTAAASASTFSFPESWRPSLRLLLAVVTVCFAGGASVLAQTPVITTLDDTSVIKLDYTTRSGVVRFLRCNCFEAVDCFSVSA